MIPLSRRQFARRLAALSGVAAIDLLAACAPALRPPAGHPTAVASLAPTNAPPATAVPWPIETSTPTPTPRPSLPRPEIMRFHPQAPSTVVHARHEGVWSGETLVSGALRQMLDASVTTLTGVQDARAAWGALFRPNERIAIKVGTISTSRFWTHVPLVMAVTDCLCEAGVPAEQIVIFDRFSAELKDAGYTVRREGPGVLCYGTDSRRQSGWTVTGAAIRLSEILLGCDALINIPLLKFHPNTGFSFAMKNHFGTTADPNKLHEANPSVEKLCYAVAELNALPPIRERTRLIIGDALNVCPSWTREGNWMWDKAVKRDSLFMSFDPVAHDRAGLQFLADVMTEEGCDPAPAEDGKASLTRAAQLGLGTDDEQRYRLVPLALN